MYLTHFGCRKNPSISPDPKYLWPDGQKKPWTAGSGILHGDGIGIVTGDLGTERPPCKRGP